MKQVFFPGLAAVLAAAVLTACGGGDGGGTTQTLGLTADTTLAANVATAAAVVNTPFVFEAGVPDLGTTGPTTLAFTNASSTPAFSITSGGNTATGVTTFGSCIFNITASTFPAGNRLALGNTITVNPCNLRIGTTGAIANSVAQSRSVALLLGAASSTNATVTVAVNAGGQLTLNGNAVGTVTLTPVQTTTGATGATAPR